MSTISATSSSTIVISQGTTANTIKYSINGGSIIDNVAGDWTIINTTPSPTDYVYVSFSTNLTFSIITHFIIGSNYIKIDGNFYTVTITGNINNYLGFVQNGTNTANSAYSNIWLTQIGILCNDTSHLNNYAGWLCQRYFCLRGGTSASLNTIEKCWTNATTDGGANHTGGLVGGNAGYCTVNNCYSTYSGAAANDSGGIVGADSTSVTVNSSYSLSTVATRSGAIFGSGATTCTTNNCYGLQPNPYSTSTNFYDGTTWSNSTASTTLLNGPTYSGGVLNSAVVGTVWTDISQGSTPIPWRLSAFNRNAYTNDYSNPYTNSTTTKPYTVSKIDTNNRLSTGTYGIIGVNTSYSNSDITLNGSNDVVFASGILNGTYRVYVLYNDTTTAFNYSVMSLTMTFSSPCFHENTLILCQHGYIPIKNIQIGDLVKTSTGEYKKVKIIGSDTIINSKDGQPFYKIYRLPKESNPDLIQDLIITGNHCILVDNLTEQQIEKSKQYWKTFHTIDNKQLLLACVGEQFIEYKEEAVAVYQIVLEDVDNFKRHGVYANGILSETMSYYTFIHKNKKRFRSIRE